MTTTPADDRYEIERLKYAYMRCIDTKNWDEVAGLFTEDAVGEWSGGAITRRGRVEIVEFFRESMSSVEFLSSHRVHQPEIDLIDDTHARGVWAMEDTVVMGEYGLLLQGAGFYEDDYVKLDGRWLIARTGYLRSFEYIVPTESLPGFRITASRWGTDGRSTLV